jgi:hypothetical protein
MDTTLFLASAWGIPMAVIALSLLINPKQVKNLFSLSEDETNVFLCGVLCLIIGVITLLQNNIWVMSWEVIVTILGWIAVTRGVVSIFWTKGMITFCQKVKNSEYLQYIILAIFFVGLILVYFGSVTKI